MEGEKEKTCRSEKRVVIPASDTRYLFSCNFCSFRSTESTVVEDRSLREKERIGVHMTTS